MRRALLALLLIYASSASAQAVYCLERAGGNTTWSANIDSAMRFHDYRGFFFGETHTHGTEPLLKLALIVHLSRNYGVRHIFMETGHAYAWLMNRYLQTGDTTLINREFYWPGGYRDFWKALYTYNNGLDPERKLRIHGVDFERKDAFRVLQLLRPAGKPLPVSLQQFFAKIEAAVRDTTLRDFTPAFAAVFRDIRNEFHKQRQELESFYGSDFTAVARIVENDNAQRSNWRPRNRSMGAAMRTTIASEGIDRFVAFFGGAHLNFDRPSSLAKQLAEMPQFSRRTVYIASLLRQPDTIGYRYLGLKANPDNPALFRRLLLPGCATAIVRGDATGEPNIRDRCDWLLMTADPGDSRF